MPPPLNPPSIRRSCVSWLITVSKQTGAARQFAVINLLLSYHPPTAPPKGTTTLFMPVATFYKVYFACRHHQQPSESSSSSSVLTILGWHLDGGFSRMPQGVQESLKYVRHIRPAGNYLWCRKTGGENYLRWVATFLATFWNQLT